MNANKKVQDKIGIILLLGTIISTGLVTIGGILFLLQYAFQPLPIELFQYHFNTIMISQIFHQAFSFSALNFITLGILLLIATQILRVALLFHFYLKERDYPFSMISFFILSMLIYSFFWRS